MQITVCKIDQAIIVVVVVVVVVGDPRNLIFKVWSKLDQYKLKYHSFVFVVTDVVVVVNGVVDPNNLSLNFA